MICLRASFKKAKGFLFVKLTAVKNLSGVTRFTSLHLTSINIHRMWRVQALIFRGSEWAEGWKELAEFMGHGGIL